MTYEEMQAKVREMAENSMLIISDVDREFVLGIELLLGMNENVPASYGERVARIYQDYQQNQYL